MLWTDFEKEYGLTIEQVSSGEKGMSAFEEPLILSCKSCKIPILAHAFQSHFSECTRGITQEVKKPSKKKLPIVKKKDKKRLDLDRHCGVLLDTGEYCVRSLKCKNHTLNMKRQVLGRSNSFDVLYNDSTRPSKITSTPPAIVNSLSPDQEVSSILKALENFTPNPFSIYHDPCILNLARLKNEFLLSEIVKLP